MASIKEEVMTVKDDCQYVRALDANGNSIRISKEDLAKVLGELIMVQGRLPNKTDWNSSSTENRSCHFIPKNRLLRHPIT